MSQNMVQSQEPHFKFGFLARKCTFISQENQWPHFKFNTRTSTSSTKLKSNFPLLEGLIKVNVYATNI